MTDSNKKRDSLPAINQRGSFLESSDSNLVSQSNGHPDEGMRNYNITTQHLHSLEPKSLESQEMDGNWMRPSSPIEEEHSDHSGSNKAMKKSAFSKPKTMREIKVTPMNLGNETSTKENILKPKLNYLTVSEDELYNMKMGS